jgi:hypothetical protein
MPFHCPGPSQSLGDIAKKLGFKNKLAFLVLLSCLIRLVVFPANRFFALLTGDIPNDVSAGSHIPLAGLARIDVDDTVEEVGFAMLATKVLFRVHISVTVAGRTGQRPAQNSPD